MKRFPYRERDYAFGQALVRLRTTIGLTQADLARMLGITRKAVSHWEVGDSYPKVSHLQALLAYALEQRAFAAGQEEEEIRAFWQAAHQKMLLDERWLETLLNQPSVSPNSVEETGVAAVVEASLAPAPFLPLTETPVAHAGVDSALSPRVDWVGALDVSHFTGREMEVARLSQWIVQERCRLVTLLGIGGIGKSMLASLLGNRLAPQFEAVLWRSVRDAPPCEELVADCLTFLSETPPAAFPSSLEQRIDQLLFRLQASRCLLVLDNLETLLASGDPEGGYLPGYEGYGRLIGRLAESAHQSCVLLTSREKPREIEPLEGEHSPVRSLRLAGMDGLTAQHLLTDKGLSGTPAAWRRLVVGYAGNPLALKIVAQAAVDLFGGDLDRFLHEGELVFNGVRPVLRQQVGRLSALEQLLLTWLAVLREWTTLDTLLQVLHPRVRRAQVLEALEALRRRSLLERGQQASFSLQSVMMEYLTETLSERLAEEIVRGAPQQLRMYALEQGQAKDHVRQTQVRLLVNPLVERLRSEAGTEALVEEYLLRLLEQFRAEDAATQGYGPANVLSLLKSLHGHLRGLDLSRLSIRRAYLQGVEMQDASLAAATLHEVVFTEALDAILAIAVSPDGRYVAVGSNSGQVRIWREEGYVMHLTLKGHTDRVSALAFTADGLALATASVDGSVRLWDRESGAAIWTVWDQRVPVTSLAISPGGKLVSGRYDGTIHLLDLRTGETLSRLYTRGGTVLAVALSTDGRLLASGGLDAVIRLWDVEQGTFWQELPGHRDWVCSLAFAPGSDASLLASGSLDRMVRVWNAQTGACLRTLEGHTHLVAGLAWTPDGRILASASHDATLRLWDSQSWQCRHILLGHREDVLSLAFLPTGERLLTGSADRTLRDWDVLSGQNVRTMQGYALGLYTLAWSPDGRFLVSGSSETTLMLWDVATRTLTRVLRGHQQQVYTVAWSRAANCIASGSADQTVRLWDAETGACTHILRGHSASVTHVNWNGDGSLLTSGSSDGYVRFWKPQEGSSRVGGEQSGPVNAVVWSPDGQLLASGGDNGLVLIWRTMDGSLLWQFKLAGVVGALCWSPNGEQLVSGAADGDKGVLSIWDIRQGTLVQRLEGHSGFIRDIEWSPHHNLLVSAGADGTVRWWNPERAVPIATVQAHEAWARAARVSPNGQTVASCGEDGLIQLWDMNSHQHLATLRADRPYERLDIGHASGLTNAQQAALRALGAVDAEKNRPS